VIILYYIDINTSIGKINDIDINRLCNMYIDINTNVMYHI